MSTPAISFSQQANSTIRVLLSPSEITEDINEIAPMFSLSVNANAIDRPVTFELGFIQQQPTSSTRVPDNAPSPDPADTSSPNEASTVLSETESEHILAYKFKPEDTCEDRKQKIMEWICCGNGDQAKIMAKRYGIDFEECQKRARLGVFSFSPKARLRFPASTSEEALSSTSTPHVHQSTTQVLRYFNSPNTLSERLRRMDYAVNHILGGDVSQFDAMLDAAIAEHGRLSGCELEAPAQHLSEDNLSVFQSQCSPANSHKFHNWRESIAPISGSSLKRKLFTTSESPEDIVGTSQDEELDMTPTQARHISKKRASLGLTSTV